MAKFRERARATETTRNGNGGAPQPGRGSRSSIVRNAVIVSVVLAFFGVALAAYKQHHDKLHDLTAIGNGVPTVVQIHDPTCPACLELRDNVRAAARGLAEDQLQVRLADIQTGKGRAMAARHGVSHVTLLFFDANGKLRDAQHGLQGVDTLRGAFRRHAAGDL